MRFWNEVGKLELKCRKDIQDTQAVDAWGNKGVTEWKSSPNRRMIRADRKY